MMKSTKSLGRASQLIIALDRSDLRETERLLKALEGMISFYKIGFELFTAHGWKAVELVQKYKARVFLDLKLHDIPNTVHKTARVVAEHGVDLVNVHALGGLEMMRRAKEAIQDASKGKTKLIAVTILTSHTQKQIQEELGIQRDIQSQVLHLACLAKSAGLDGVVSSPLEIEPIRKAIPKDFLIVTPGIRLEGDKKDDQNRTLSPGEALARGADFIVVGRSLTEAENPSKRCQEIIELISQ